MRMKSGSGGADAGFTMIELAMAIFLMALLFGSIAIPLRAQIEMRKVELTKHILDSARTALLGYAIANGRLPCPADEGSVGQEATGANHETGHCPTYFGFLPAAALGMDAPEARGYVVDAWGSPAHRIRYAVSPHGVGAVANAFTRVNGMRSAGIARLSDPALSLFHICDSGSGNTAGASCGKALTLVSTTPAVIWSSGANAATGGASVHEAQNPNVNGGSVDRVFVSAVRSNAASAEFDDQVAWIPMAVLLHRLLAAGQVP
jgi:prepilin-type N-terminal cleavage/methylation domain-containing protein